MNFTFKSTNDNRSTMSASLASALPPIKGIGSEADSFFDQEPTRILECRGTRTYANSVAANCKVDVIKFKLTKVNSKKPKEKPLVYKFQSYDPSKLKVVPCDSSKNMYNSQIKKFMENPRLKATFLNIMTFLMCPTLSQHSPSIPLVFSSAFKLASFVRPNPDFKATPSTMVEPSKFSLLFHKALTHYFNYNNKLFPLFLGSDRFSSLPHLTQTAIIASGLLWIEEDDNVIKYKSRLNTILLFNLKNCSTLRPNLDTLQVLLIYIFGLNSTACSGRLSFAFMGVCVRISDILGLNLPPPLSKSRQRAERIMAFNTLNYIRSYFGLAVVPIVSYPNPLLSQYQPSYILSSPRPISTSFAVLVQNNSPILLFNDFLANFDHIIYRLIELKQLVSEPSSFDLIETKVSDLIKRSDIACLKFYTLFTNLETTQPKYHTFIPQYKIAIQAHCYFIRFFTLSLKFFNPDPTSKSIKKDDSPLSSSLPLMDLACLEATKVIDRIASLELSSITNVGQAMLCQCLGFLIKSRISTTVNVWISIHQGTDLLDQLSKLPYHTLLSKTNKIVLENIAEFTSKSQVLSSTSN